MKNSEIKELSTKELQERIDAEKETMVKMRMNHAVSPLDNPIKLRFVKKDIARMKTELVKRKTSENTKTE